LERSPNSLFPRIFGLFFPLAYQAINWTQPHTFLDQELAQIVRDGEIGKRRIDRLVQVTTLNSTLEWVYIHIEVQSQVDSDFAERLFTYNYRLYDRYHRPVATLAVLADESLNWRPEGFSYNLLTQRTRKDVEARYTAKWQLAKLLYERDWGKQQIIDLFAVIDWLMTLPPELEKQLWTSISELGSAE